MFAMDNRQRLAPVSLSGEYPVAQFEINFLSAPALFFHHFGHFFLCLGNSHAIPAAGIDYNTITGICFFQRRFQTAVLRCDNRDNRKIEFRCKVKVAFIMRRNNHDCTCAVIRQRIVSYPDRDFFLCYRIYTVGTNKLTCFFFICHSVNRGLCRCFKAIFFYGFFTVSRCQLCQFRIFRRKYHCGTTV